MRKEIKFVGNYKILDIIAKGGMAKVYSAIQMPLNRVVVVKEMSKSSGGEFRKRFKQEALITATLEHPNIISIYDYFTIGSSSYLVMQYVDGVSLAEIIACEAPLSPVLAAAIAREVCLAIDHAHQNNVIHRDIKPTNILISRNGKLKVTDFGVAKDETARDQTSVGTLIGTPCYMSPEQAMGKKLSAQSDIFSLGIVLFEMVTGKKPFWGESVEEITAKIGRGKYKSPLWLDPHHSYRLARIINKSLKKNLNRRYESVAKMIKDLDLFLGWKNLANSQQLMSTVTERVDQTKHRTTVIKRPKKKKRKRKQTNVFYLYFLLIVVITALIFVLFRILLHI
jgi:serine/threonine-protein kinase